MYVGLFCPKKAYQKLKMKQFKGLVWFRGV